MVSVKVEHGDCLNVLRTMPSASVDSIVTDPPAGIAFMGKDWDHHKGGRKEWVAWMAEIAAECLRVIKPGGHALVWALPRTSHWTATAWEDGGFEIRDRIAHVFGSGFPKSLDVSKAIDKAAGMERITVCRDPNWRKSAHTESVYSGGMKRPENLTAPATEAAKQWQGWGTALKPAMEDWWLCRKPLIGTVAENVQKWGTGALNIDGCRVETDENLNGWAYSGGKKDLCAASSYATGVNAGSFVQPTGRWPANLIHDGSDEVVGLFPDSKGQQGDVCGTEPSHTGEGACYGQYGRVPAAARGDSGSAARFFYCAKASKADRDDGCEGIPESLSRRYGEQGQGSTQKQTPRTAVAQRNGHPCVKPTSLMRYLCRLATPPGGIILDPFMGSGSTGKAAILEGFRFIGIEQDPEYFAIAERRVRHAMATVQPSLDLPQPRQANG